MEKKSIYYTGNSLESNILPYIKLNFELIDLLNKELRIKLLNIGGDFKSLIPQHIKKYNLYIIEPVVSTIDTTKKLMQDNFEIGSLTLEYFLLKIGKHNSSLNMPNLSAMTTKKKFGYK